MSYYESLIEILNKIESMELYKGGLLYNCFIFDIEQQKKIVRFSIERELNRICSELVGE